MQNRYTRALTIAGSDSGGGAGIQADLKAFSANGVYGMSAITALTAQNTQGVNAIHPVPVDFLEQQIRAVLDDIGCDVVKIGMLHSVEVIHTVVTLLMEYKIKNVIIDPVMVATSGDKLLQDEAIRTLISDLLPRGLLITPNIPEAEIILDKTIDNSNDMRSIAVELASVTGTAVLLKSGHATKANSADVLCFPGEAHVMEFFFEKVETKNTHGTGCTLSSAIAAHIGEGVSLSDSVAAGLQYTREGIKAGARYSLGRGNGPLHHFYAFWD